MNKKENILEILYYLGEENIWNLAKPLANMIEKSEVVDEELIDIINEIISTSIKNVNDKSTIDALNKAKSMLDTMKWQEQRDKENDLKESEKLLNNI